MKQSDVNLRSILKGFYKTLGAETKKDKNGNIIYYILVKGIVNKEGQPIPIHLIHSNPFQAISTYKRRIPSIYFEVSVDEDTARYFGSTETKYYEEQYDEEGNYVSLEMKRQGDPVNYVFTLTAEVRNEMEGVEISNYFRNHTPLPSGRFLWENEYSKGITALTYHSASITRARQMFDLVTNSSIITLSFTVIGHWDYREEERYEVPKIDKSRVIDSVKK